MGLAKETCDWCFRTVQMNDEPTSVISGRYLFCRDCIEKNKRMLNICINELAKEKKND